MVERAAPGGEGYAIDHFICEAVKNYFKKFDDAFKGYDISYLGHFLTIHMKWMMQEDKRTGHRSLFEEFQKRRGYDLKNHLPALFGKDDRNK